MILMILNQYLLIYHFSILKRLHPRSSLFPYTTLFRSNFSTPFLPLFIQELGVTDRTELVLWTGMAFGAGSHTKLLEDRKSTRLNSSHVAISYAVFCLKKKKK